MTIAFGLVLAASGSAALAALLLSMSKKLPLARRLGQIALWTRLVGCQSR